MHAYYTNSSADVETQFEGGFQTTTEIVPTNLCIPVKNDLWIYFVVLVSISGGFLLVSIIALLAIREKQRTQGWTQFSYMCASLFFNVVFIPALTPGLASNNGEILLGCYILSILNQYFFVSSKTWLLIISYDMYRRIRTTRSFQFSYSGFSTSFKIYSIIGWMLPVIIVGCGVVINLCNRTTFEHGNQDLWTSVPDYGCGHCRIPSWNVWECFVIVNCVFHFFMFGLISFTIFKQRTNLESLESRTTQKKQSPLVLLARLFVIVGLNWSYIAIQDIFGAGNINTNQSGWWHVFRSSFFLQGAFVSMVLMFNGNTWKCLKQKYPSLEGFQKRLSTILKRCNCFRKDERKDSLQSCASNSTISTLS